MNLPLDAIKANLSKSYDPSLLPECPYPIDISDPTIQKSLKKAAVFIPFLLWEDEWHLLFIRRSKTREDLHSGQVAFPGGLCNPHDTDFVHAAIRELSEEIGVSPKDTELLGRIRDMVTITLYQVTSIVGLIPWPYPVVLQPEEVSHIFTVPLRWLADPSNREVQKKEYQDGGQVIPVIYYKPYMGEILWGASARITILMLEALGLSDPEERYV